MMTLDYIYRLVAHYTAKHYSGKTLTPEMFTDVVIKENIELFAKVFQDVKVSMEKNDSSLSEAVNLIGGLSTFLKYLTDKTVTDGILTLESDYYYYDAFYLQSAGLFRPVEVLLEADAQMRKTSMLSRSLTEHPICVIAEEKARFTPNFGKSVKCNYSYLKRPIDPFYDYCIKVDSNTPVYMPVGSVITASPGAGWDLKASAGGAIIAQNVTHLLFPSQEYPSRTVELEFEDSEILTIIKNILTREGIALRDTELFQLEKADKE